MQLGCLIFHNLSNLTRLPHMTSAAPTSWSEMYEMKCSCTRWQYRWSSGHQLNFPSMTLIFPSLITVEWPGEASTRHLSSLPRQSIPPSRCVFPVRHQSQRKGLSKLEEVWVASTHPYLGKTGGWGGFFSIKTCKGNARLCLFTQQACPGKRQTSRLITWWLLEALRGTELVSVWMCVI